MSDNFSSPIWPDPVPLKIYNASEFLALDLPEPKFILHPWLPKAGLVMVHAWTGIGKTMFSLACAVTIASGNPAILLIEVCGERLALLL